MLRVLTDKKIARLVYTKKYLRLCSQRKKKQSYIIRCWGTGRGIRSRKYEGTDHEGKIRHTQV